MFGSLLAALPLIVRSSRELGVRDTALVPRQRHLPDRVDERRRECRLRRRAGFSGP
jgi:hypothetical protein